MIFFLINQNGFNINPNITCIDVCFITLEKRNAKNCA